MLAAWPLKSLQAKPACDVPTACYQPEMMADNSSFVHY